MEGLGERWKRYAGMSLAGAVLMAGVSAPVSYALDEESWDDEVEEEEEVPEGAERFDTSSETVANIASDNISMSSIASPVLFNNIGAGDLSVQWDVYITPASGVTSNENIPVTLSYRTAFDLRVDVERCEGEYPTGPNTLDDTGGTESCEGATQDWETIEVEADQYLSDVRDTQYIGDFNLQNGAYLRLTVEPSGEVSMGDRVDLSVNAQAFGERVSIGNTAGTGHVEGSVSDGDAPEDDIDSTEEDADDNDEAAEETEEPTESPTPTQTEEPEEEETEEETQAPTAEETPAAEEEADEDGFGIVEMVIAGVLLLLVIPLGIWFLRWRDRKKEEYYLGDEDDDDDYDDDDD